MRDFEIGFEQIKVPLEETNMRLTKAFEIIINEIFKQQIEDGK